MYQALRAWWSGSDRPAGVPANNAGGRTAPTSAATRSRKDRAVVATDERCDRDDALSARRAEVDTLAAAVKPSDDVAAAGSPAAQLHAVVAQAYAALAQMSGTEVADGSDDNGDTALHAACFRGDVATVEALLTRAVAAADSDGPATDDSDESALEARRRAVARWANRPWGCARIPPLHAAVHGAVVAAASPPPPADTAADEDATAARHRQWQVATARRFRAYASVLAILAAAGASGTAVDAAGHSAVHLVAGLHTSVMEEGTTTDHCDAGDKDGKDDSGSSGHRSTQQVPWMLLPTLRRLGADPNVPDRFGRVAVTRAIEAGSVDQLTYLLQIGADPTAERRDPDVFGDLESDTIRTLVDDSLDVADACLRPGNAVELRYHADTDDDSPAKRDAPDAADAAAGARPRGFVSHATDRSVLGEVEVVLEAARARHDYAAARSHVEGTHCLLHWLKVVPGNGDRDGGQQPAPVGRFMLTRAQHAAVVRDWWPSPNASSTVDRGACFLASCDDCCVDPAVGPDVTRNVEERLVAWMTARRDDARADDPRLHQKVPPVSFFLQACFDGDADAVLEQLTSLPPAERHMRVLYRETPLRIPALHAAVLGVAAWPSARVGRAPPHLDLLPLLVAEGADLAARTVGGETALAVLLRVIAASHSMCSGPAQKPRPELTYALATLLRPPFGPTDVAALRSLLPPVVAVVPREAVLVPELVMLGAPLALVAALLYGGDTAHLRSDLDVASGIAPKEGGTDPAAGDDAVTPHRAGTIVVLGDMAADLAGLPPDTLGEVLVTSAAARMTAIAVDGLSMPLKAPMKRAAALRVVPCAHASEHTRETLLLPADGHMLAPIRESTRSSGACTAVVTVEYSAAEGRNLCGRAPICVDLSPDAAPSGGGGGASRNHVRLRYAVGAPGYAALARLLGGARDHVAAAAHVDHAAVWLHATKHQPPLSGVRS